MKICAQTKIASSNPPRPCVGECALDVGGDSGIRKCAIGNNGQSIGVGPQFLPPGSRDSLGKVRILLSASREQEIQPQYYRKQHCLRRLILHTKL